MSPSVTILGGGSVWSCPLCKEEVARGQDVLVYEVGQMFHEAMGAYHDMIEKQLQDHMRSRHPWRAWLWRHTGWKWALGA